MRIFLLNLQVNCSLSSRRLRKYGAVVTIWFVSSLSIIINYQTHRNREEQEYFLNDSLRSMLYSLCYGCISFPHALEENIIVAISGFHIGLEYFSNLVNIYVLFKSYFYVLFSISSLLDCIAFSVELDGFWKVDFVVITPIQQERNAEWETRQWKRRSDLPLPLASNKD